MQIAFILTKICVEVERLKFNFRFIQVCGRKYTYGLILYLYVCLSSYVMVILAGYLIGFVSIAIKRTSLFTFMFHVMKSKTQVRANIVEIFNILCHCKMNDSCYFVNLKIN